MPGTLSHNLVIASRYPVLSYHDHYEKRGHHKVDCALNCHDVSTHAHLARDRLHSYLGHGLRAGKHRPRRILLARQQPAQHDLRTRRRRCAFDGLSPHRSAAAQRTLARGGQSLRIQPALACAHLPRRHRIACLALLASGHAYANAFQFEFERDRRERRLALPLLRISDRLLRRECHLRRPPQRRARSTSGRQ